MGSWIRLGYEREPMVIVKFMKNYSEEDYIHTKRLWQHFYKAPNLNIRPLYYNLWAPLQISKLSLKPICECGGDKCNTTHSDWCPKT